MPTPSNNHNRTRSRWGICLNDACQKSKNKERQEITGRKDFVCSECGRPLKECPPPPPAKWPKFVAIGVAVLAIGGGAYWGLSSSGDEKQPETKATTAQVAQTQQTQAGDVDDMPEGPLDNTDLSQSAQPDMNGPKSAVEKKDDKRIDKTPGQTTSGKGTSVTGGSTKTNNPTYGTVKLSYGSYTGDLRNGKPHGHGKVRFTTSYRLVSSQNHMASPGDTYEGEFRDGRISGGMGYWTHDGGEQTLIKP